MWNSLLSEAWLLQVITLREMSEKIDILVTLLRGFCSTPTKLEIKIEIPQIEFPIKNLIALR